MQNLQIVGALNVTPDSFYDGGKHFDAQAAVEHGLTLIRDGADIIEIGGESSLQSDSISAEEELRRVIPVLQVLRKKSPHTFFSIDTMKSEVAEAAISEGVLMVNDVSAGRSDSRMFSVLAGVPEVSLVLMYSKDIPPTTKEDHQYPDVIGTVREFLARRAEAAIGKGIAPERIILDPGLGFFISSDPKYSFEILSRLHEFMSLGFPLFVSPSRKSFLAGPEKLPPAERLPATIAASAIAVMNGAEFIRTHDVKEVKQACIVATSIREAC